MKAGRLAVDAFNSEDPNASRAIAMMKEIELFDDKVPLTRLISIANAPRETKKYRELGDRKEGVGATGLKYDNSQRGCPAHHVCVSAASAAGGGASVAVAQGQRYCARPQHRGQEIDNPSQVGYLTKNREKRQSHK